MKTDSKIYFLIFFLLSASTIFAQFNGNKFAVGAGYNYTTTARLFLNPHASDSFLRDEYEYIEDIVSYSLNLRYRISDEVVIGLSTELMEVDEVYTIITGLGQTGSVDVLVNDGFKLIPIELSAYYLMPFSSESFKFYMGGGIGFYFGEHTRKFSDVEVTTEESEMAYGIHVATGLEYMITEFLSFRFEMRFRDPEFEMTNKYSKTTFEYDNQQVLINAERFDSKANVDGITFSFAAAFHF